MKPWRYNISQPNIGQAFLGCTDAYHLFQACVFAAIVLISGSLAPAYGAQVNVRAEFKPDPSKPQNNAFTNKTPSNSNFCTKYPSSCTSRNIVSIAAPISLTTANPITANHADPRQGVMVRINNEWRTLNVSQAETAKVEQVRIRITGFGTHSNISPNNIHELVLEATSWSNGWEKLWAGGYISSGSGSCIGLHAPYLNGSRFGFFWSTPISEAVCSRKALYDIPKLVYPTLDFSYEIETPNPLTMSTGDYTGSISYTVGPNQDFDFGDNMIPNDNTLTLNFILTVQHTLKVDIPPGGEKVELTPKGGWQQWLQKGRIPEKLYRDQSFLLSASSRFKMLLTCDKVIDDTCAISNGSHDVPVDVMVSMPNGIGNDDNSAVSRKKLGVTTAQIFKSTHYVANKPSTLHFEIQKQYVEEMLREQGKYKGNITVVWDSEV